MRKPSQSFVFERWGSPEEGLDVGGEYSRRAWFPSLGPDAWLVWGSIASGLGRYRRVECLADELAHAHGLRCSAIGPAVDRLVRFGLAAGPTGGAGLAGSAGLAGPGPLPGAAHGGPGRPAGPARPLGPGRPARLDGGAAAVAGLGALGARVAACDDVWQVRRACPPLADALLTRAPVEVVAMHLRLFGDGRHPRPSHRWSRRHRPRLASGRAS